MPAQLRHITAASIPTTAGKGQETGNDDGVEEGADLSLPDSAGFSASEVDQIGAQLTRMMEGGFPAGDERLDLLVENCWYVANHLFPLVDVMNEGQSNAGGPIC
jgi:hypothetical protein